MRHHKELEEYAPHPPAHSLFVVHGVKHVDKLVEIVGRLHDSSKESDESNIIALGEELWSEPV